ncbi:MAG: hypothetical protein KJO79_10190 [Verrucomicrobiae bacterium]|nr:hypothetical protein [Verrucomicrobiae bacterium]NNJ87539.1 hypothetical protein [Akkermansiaceae bacterium]
MQPSATETPVLFIIFNRPDTTQKVFQTITKARPSRLYIAADAPRPEVKGEAEKCQAAREITQQIDWDCEIHTLLHNSNQGCKAAICHAITWFFDHEELGIILEDDCLPAPSFFGFCSELLERYRYDDRIMMISGTNLMIETPEITSSYYFSRLPHIWGWAGWRRAWDVHDPEMKSFPEFFSNNRHHELFLDNNVAYYWLRLWLITYLDKIDTWDYAWVYSCFVNNGLAITPKKNLISNIGFGEHSTHTKNSHSKYSNMPSYEIDRIEHPAFVYCNEKADTEEYRKLRVYPRIAKPTIKYRIKRRRRLSKYKRKIREQIKEHPIDHEKTPIHRT